MGLRAIKIDTLALAKELENAGIPRPQAEAQIQTTIKVIDMAIEEKLVTKHDLNHALHRTEEKLLAEIAKLHETDEKLSSSVISLEHKLDKNVISLELSISRSANKLILIVGGMITAAVAILGTLTTVLLKF